jgi:hypothetical protein
LEPADGVRVRREEDVMTNTLFALVDAARSALNCVWIETGNPRQPLARVWIDREVRIAHDDEDRQHEGDSLCCADAA